MRVSLYSIIAVSQRPTNRKLAFLHLLTWQSLTCPATRTTATISSSKESPSVDTRSNSLQSPGRFSLSRPSITLEDRPWRSILLYWLEISRGCSRIARNDGSIDFWRRRGVGLPRMITRKATTMNLKPRTRCRRYCIEIETRLDCIRNGVSCGFSGCCN